MRYVIKNSFAPTNQFSIWDEILSQTKNNNKIIKVSYLLTIRKMNFEIVRVDISSNRQIFSINTWCLGVRFHTLG